MNNQLLSSILKFVDAHVAICLLDFAKQKKSVDEQSYGKFKLNLLLRTKRHAETLVCLEGMKASVAENVYTRLVGQLKQKEQETKQQLESLKESVKEMTDLIIKDYGSEEKFIEENSKTRQTKDAKFIAIPKVTVDMNLEYAFLAYEMGDFKDAGYMVQKLFCIVEGHQDL